MITNRKTRWFVAFVGVVLCVLMFAIIRAQRAGAQSANEFYVSSSDCRGMSLKWNDVPLDHIPGSGGVVQLLCPWGSYTWSGPTYLFDEFRDFYYYSGPVSWQDIPDSGNNWGSCLIAGYLNYSINSIQYHKHITYPTGYDGYLDCDLKQLPMIMHYGPRLYQVYDPYPGPGEDGMSGGFMLEESQSIFVEQDNPYP